MVSSRGQCAVFVCTPEQCPVLANSRCRRLGRPCHGYVDATSVMRPQGPLTKAGDHRADFFGELVRSPPWPSAEVAAPGRIHCTRAELPSLWVATPTNNSSTEEWPDLTRRWNSPDPLFEIDESTLHHSSIVQAATAGMIQITISEPCIRQSQLSNLLRGSR